MKFISAVSVNDKENADNGSESDIFSRSHASWQHFVMRFAWPLAITEWSVIYTQSWFTTPKLRWILSMATLSSFSPFLRHLSHSRSVSVVCTPIEDKDRECLHVSSRNTTVSTFNYTCMDTVPHKSPRAVPARKKYREYFRNPLSILAPVIGRVCRVVLRRFVCDFLQMRSVENYF